MYGVVLQIAVKERDFVLASSVLFLHISQHDILIMILRAVVSPAKALIPAIHPLLCATLQEILHIVSRIFPHAEQQLQKKRGQG